MRTVLLLLLLSLYQWCEFIPVLAGDKPRIFFLAGEYEYHSKETLPEFARELQKTFDVETAVLQRPDDSKLETIPGVEKLASADLAIFFIRRMTLPEEELAHIRNYISSGKPIIGLRTASHSFQNWKEFDRDILGGNYQGHHGSALKTKISIPSEAAQHPILKGFSPFVSDGSLYRNTPLQRGTLPLLSGKVEGHPAEPIAWTHNYKGARVFYTSLGHPNDFKEQSFRTLLRNAIEWALDKPLKKTESK